jgi:hypothetical protein
VVWDGQPRIVEGEAVDTEPLAGMSLLEQHALRSTSSTAVVTLSVMMTSSSSRELLALRIELLMRFLKERTFQLMEESLFAFM